MKEGDKIFIKTCGNAARCRGSRIIDTVITKVGRKYFFVKDLPRIKFSIDTMREVTDYCVDYVAYISKEKILEEIELSSLNAKIKEFFIYNAKKLTLDQLRQIDEIITQKI